MYALLHSGDRPPFASLLPFLELLAIILAGTGSLVYALLRLDNGKECRSAQRPLIGVSGVIVMAGCAQLLQAVFPLLNSTSLTTWVNISWLTLAIAMSGGLLLLARDRREGIALFILLDAEVVALAVTSKSLLPPSFPIFALVAVFSAIGIVAVFLFWWRDIAQHTVPDTSPVIFAGDLLALVSILAIWWFYLYVVVFLWQWYFLQGLPYVFICAGLFYTVVLLPALVGFKRYTNKYIPQPPRLHLVELHREA